MSSSLASLIASLPPSERAELLSTLSPGEQEALVHEWSFWARPEQLPPPGDWRTWLLLSGRGFGKTRTASEWVRDQVEKGKRRSIGLIGPTKEATRKVMVEGVSGILSVCPPWNRPVFEPSNLRLVWPSGAMAHLFTAEEPEKLRGPNLDAAWSDELCAWGTPDQVSTVYDMLSLCLRIPGPLGDPPQEIISTTPKPLPLLRAIMKNPSTVKTGGSTLDNAANLDKNTLKYLVDKYQGTRLGRQELYAEVLDAFEGALWSPEMLDRARLTLASGAGPGWKVMHGSNSGMAYLANNETGRCIYFKRIVVSVDPAGTANRKSNETGIVVCGLGEDDDGYVLEDLSGIYAPEQWASKAVGAYEDWNADRILAEINYGGDMVAATIRAVNRNVPVRTLTASKGKRVRAEPVAALDEQARIHHVGQFEKMEDQLVTWDPFGNGDSPDRLDARVWGFTDLMLKRGSLAPRQLIHSGPLPIYQR